MRSNELRQTVDIRCPICSSSEIVFLRPYRATLAGSMKVFSDLSVWTCQTCSVGFAYPFPPKEALDGYYATGYRGEGSQRRLEREPGQWGAQYARARSQIEFVCQRAKAVRGGPRIIGSWLDIGTGYGFLLDTVKEWGVDKTGAVEPGRHSQAYLKMHGHRIYDDLYQVDGSWDVVSFSHLLEHLSTPRVFLHHVKYLLSDKGYVFCEVPNELRLQDAKNDVPHLIFFTVASLELLFEDVGFEVLTVETCGGKWGGRYPDTLIRVIRLLGGRMFPYPPKWLERVIRPHFWYSKKGDRKWIRLLARKRVV